MSKIREKFSFRDRFKFIDIYLSNREQKRKDEHIDAVKEDNDIVHAEIDERLEKNHKLQKEYAIGLETLLKNGADFQNYAFSSLSPDKGVIKITYETVDDANNPTLKSGNVIERIRATVDGKKLYEIDIDWSMDIGAIRVKSYHKLLNVYLGNPDEFLKNPQSNNGVNNNTQKSFIDEVTHDYEKKDKRVIKSLIAIFTNSYKFAVWAKMSQNKIEDALKNDTRVSSEMFKSEYEFISMISEGALFKFSVSSKSKPIESGNVISGTVIPHLSSVGIQYIIADNPKKFFPMEKASNFMRQVIHGLSEKNDDVQKWYKLSVAESN